MIADGTVLRFHELLAEVYDGRREEQAGARFHLLHNVTEQTIDRFSVTDEKRHDSTQFGQDRGSKVGCDPRSGL